MSEVLSRILKHYFEDIRVNRVEAIHYRLNPASGKVMAKCGMKQEGIGIQELKIKGLYHDVVHYAITQKCGKDVDITLCNAKLTKIIKVQWQVGSKKVTA
ncbi:MAG: GNAT family N-acetyltransferase [Streptococcus sp.]